MPASVPKFASFRPKAKDPAPSPPARAPRQDIATQPTLSRERSRDEPTQPRDKHQRRRDEPQKAYFSDRRGDVDILKYGTPSRYQIPSYRRSGFGNVLGLPGQTIDRDSSSEKAIYVIPLVRQRQKRMLVDKHAAKQSKRTLRLIHTAQDHHTHVPRDYIPLSSSTKRKGTSASDDEDGLHDAPGVDYRGLDDKYDPDHVDDPDTYYELDTEAASATSQVTQKNSRLVRETREDPTNLQAWLDLIHHQEAMMKLDRAVTDLSVADRQNLADVRISTYEEALRKVVDDEAKRIELQLGLLKEAQRYWDHAKVATRWRDALTKHPRSVKLWFGYLDFAQSAFSSFKYEDCRALFLQALEALRPSHFAGESIALQASMHLFVRLTTMIQEAGYQELALATWQAILEFSLLAPEDLSGDRLQKFEDFWESEAPRIGEPDSKGWRHTSIDNVTPPMSSITLETTSSSTSASEDFRRREIESMTKLRYPGRSTDEVGEDDPFHTIFFSDLRSYLASLPLVSGEMLVDAFLCFCRLPRLATTSPEFSWRTDPILQSETFRYDYKSGTETGNLQYQVALAHYSQSPFTQFQMTRRLLLQQPFSLDTSMLSPDFLRNVLKLLADNTPESDLVAEYLLAFECKYFPAEIAKSARRLLRNRPSSLRLYNMYGLIEGHLGNSAKADQIYAAALNIDRPSADRLELLSSYIWQALQEGNKLEALQRLVQHAGEASSSQMVSSDSVRIAATRTALQASLEQALLKDDYHSAVLNTTFLSLLTYLSSEYDAGAALSVHDNLIVWFVSHNLASSAPAEIHAQAIAHFLAYHVAHTSIVKPSLLRTKLEPIIATFPSNTILLSTYAANEARFAIDDRVRGNMHRVLNTSLTTNIPALTFGIHHEILKGEVAGSTSHSIRALYKRATDLDASGAHCLALWKMFLRFELEQLQKEQSLQSNKRLRRDGKKNKWETRVDAAQDRVREAFYQGLKRLPWCKNFVMLAFTDAKDVFAEEDLWKLYQVMMEKEQRVYTEIDEKEAGVFIHQ